MSRVNRRKFLRNSLAAGGAISLGGCDRLSQSKWFPKVLDNGETLSGMPKQASHRGSGLRESTRQEKLPPTFAATDPPIRKHQHMWRSQPTSSKTIALKSAD